MSLRIISKQHQAYGAFNGGQIIENKPIGFPREGGFVRPYSNLFYWARAQAVIDSTIGLHPHQGFEIMSFVLDGRIRHFDTKMNAWKDLEAGSVQIIRAGDGIEHAEHMNKGAVMFQIWTDPDLSKTLSHPASYSDYAEGEFPVQQSGENKVRTLIGEGSPLSLVTEPLQIERWSISEPHTFEVEEGSVYSFYLISGEAQVGDQTAEADSFIIADDMKEVVFIPHQTIDLFMIKGPQETRYPTYAQRMLASN